MAKKTPAKDSAEKPAAKKSSRKSKSPPANAPAVELPYIHESLRQLAVPIVELHPDPRNARTHDEANLAAIRGSLEKFGQRLPLVVQRDGMIVRAGNGRLEAARQLGWTHVAAVIVDEDQVDAAAFALTDNRTAELAAWDPHTLDSLLAELQGVEFGVPDLDAMLGDLAAFSAELLEPPANPAASETSTPPADADSDTTPPADKPPEQAREVFEIIVKLSSEEEQTELLEQLTEDGYECRALIA